MDSKIVAFIVGFVGSYFLVTAWIKANPINAIASSIK